MSKVIRREPGRTMAHIVEVGDNAYYIDSCDTFDNGFETMVFEYNLKLNEVESWMDLYCETYSTSEEMEEGHEHICNNLEEYL